MNSTSAGKAVKWLKEQLACWTLVGPIFAPEGEDLWSPLDIDGLDRVPSSFQFDGRNVPVRKVELTGGIIDFERQVGKLVDRTRTGIRNQVVAFNELDLPERGTITFTYDADSQAVWWIDGREVYATRDWNGGPVGRMKHHFMVGLEKGKHTISVRVISSDKGWKLVLQPPKWRRGIADRLRSDRRAAWRDYTRSVVRLEERPAPDGTCGGLSKEDYERWMSSLGIDARWISVVHNCEGSYYRSPHLPMWEGAKPEHEKELAEWVKELHKNKMCAMSWYPLSLCSAAWNKYPDWRQKYLVADPGVKNTRRTCCINSPYGDAVIAYVIEAIRKFDLDGFWFDGASFSPIWERPQPISCVCRHCAKRFKSDTGLELPSDYDWTSADFRRWVQWRYDMYAEYWQRLVDEVHAAVPEATIAFNHYHREIVGWNGAIPLRPFGRDFVRGTEAEGEPMKGAFHTRLMRAYGQPHTEVWMSNGSARKAVAGASDVVSNYREVMDFVLACATAGGLPSVGNVQFPGEGRIMAEIARELKPRAPFVGLPSVPYIALHVSQQTETFVFGRNPRYVTEPWTDYYWNSLTGWHHVIAHAGLTCDVVFDYHLTKRRLAKYPYLIMPLAAALTKQQYKVVMDYVRAGGILITGPWFAIFDRVGESGRGYPLGDRTLFPFGESMPGWDEIENRPEVEFSLGCGGASHPVKARPLSQLPQSVGSVPLRLSATGPAVSHRKLGKGKVIQLAFDLGTLFRYSEAQPVVAGLRDLFHATTMPRPLAELVDEDDFILGLFKKGRDTTVVHLQQFYPPWQEQGIGVRRPRTRWSVLLQWNGDRPRSVRCALPEMSPELPVRKSGAAWRIALPPCVWGQVVVIRT